MKRDYDEAGYLKYYLFRWHGDLIADGEKYPTKDYFRIAVPSASDADIAAVLSDGDLEVSTPEVEKALLATWDAFNAELCKRMLAQHGLAIRRCPKCSRILESPKARLCLWCDYNEYGSDNRAVEPTS
jgi:hypothetical protein